MSNYSKQNASRQKISVCFLSAFLNKRPLPMAIPQSTKIARWGKSSQTLTSQKRWENVSSLHLWKQVESMAFKVEEVWLCLIPQWIWVQQSLLLLLCRTALWLKSNFPRTWLSGEGAVTNVHLGESSQVSWIYHTHTHIETTKEKQSISDRKNGFLKKLVNSTILGFVNQNK